MSQQGAEQMFWWPSLFYSDCDVVKVQVCWFNSTTVTRLCSGPETQVCCIFNVHT